MGDKSETMILIGYYPTGAYKLFDPLSKKVFYCRDVYVAEGEQWAWKSEEGRTRKVPFDVEVFIELRTDHEGPDQIGLNDQHQREQRQRNLSRRFCKYEMTHDSNVTDEGELIHFALLADAAPLSLEEALQKSVWKIAMIDEINTIERNKT